MNEVIGFEMKAEVRRNNGRTKKNTVIVSSKFLVHSFFGNVCTISKKNSISKTSNAAINHVRSSGNKKAAEAAVMPIKMKRDTLNESTVHLSPYYPT